MSARISIVGMPHLGDLRVRARHDRLRVPEPVKFAFIWLVVFCLLVATELGGLYLLDALD